MNTNNIDNNKPTDTQKQSDELSSEKKPTKRIRRQATEEQLSNPFHGVKLVEVLELLVAHYVWEYIGAYT
jgi:uncharacterized protein (DUF2132 family)